MNPNPKPNPNGVLITGQPCLQTSDLAGSTTLTLVADLRKGQGDTAWQHTQLFRQKMDATEDPLVIKITLREN